MSRRWWPAPGVAVLVMLAAVGTSGARSVPQTHGHRYPNILILSVDTMRADRLSSAGYRRPITPNIDRIVRRGVNFTLARTVEPLTNPSLTSLFTSLYPHQHGATRNGLRMQPGLPSLGKVLAAHGYRTAAFVGNWTLREKLSGLAEHFGEYHEVLTRRRWFGMLRSEATADDITEEGLDWLADDLRHHSDQPFFLWLHYVEPHAPYRMHREFAAKLGIPEKDASPSDRYDTEIAFADRAIGRVLDDMDRRGLLRDSLVIFLSDHGESLGEHGYWGHGRNLYEVTLRIPMAICWPARLHPATADAPSLIIDLAPTVLGLVGLPIPGSFLGYDWTSVLRGAAKPPTKRVTRYQAHKGAVISNHRSDLARGSGLLSVGLIRGTRKECFRVKKDRRRVFDLARDPAERKSLEKPRSTPSPALMKWLREILDGLQSLDRAVPKPLDQESARQLRSLGYVQ